MALPRHLTQAIPTRINHIVTIGPAMPTAPTLLRGSLEIMPWLIELK
jgi:hypothetical protein